MFTLQNIDDAPISNLIGVICNTHMPDEMYFEAVIDIDIELSNGDNITIPRAFKSDGSSTPKILRGILPRYGPFLFAAIIHDYMYRNGYMEEIGIDEGRKFCDLEMLKWSNRINNRTLGNYFDNYSRYLGVRIGGKSSYKHKRNVSR